MKEKEEVRKKKPLAPGEKRAQFLTDEEVKAMTSRVVETTPNIIEVKGVKIDFSKVMPGFCQNCKGSGRTKTIKHGDTPCPSCEGKGFVLRSIEHLQRAPVQPKHISPEIRSLGIERRTGKKGRRERE